MGSCMLQYQSADVITADGNLVTASEGEHTDLLWAVRGGGPGFFGVVTKYRLKLFAALRAITTTNYYFALRQAERDGTWARIIANLLAKHVELTIFFSPAPPPLAPVCARDMGNGCARTWVHPTGMLDLREEVVRMPWREVTRVSLRKEFVLLALQAGSNRREAVPALRDRAEDRLQVAGALCAGGGERS